MITLAIDFTRHGTNAQKLVADREVVPLKASLTTIS